MEERQLIGKRIIGLHPGCDTRKNHAQRRWPTAQFADLCSRLSARPETVVLVFGGPEETTLKHSVVDGLGERVLVVDTPSLLDTCALIERCVHFISNDSGLMHLAGAWASRRPPSLDRPIPSGCGIHGAFGPKSP
ncbi:MAG: glycosyltransferase family 9 protein [Candidatus Competibacteraceae bacterium]|nr:glycosyltransferase family 9 protein [Candidatus Competibacteraceae bacterium]